MPLLQLLFTMSLSACSTPVQESPTHLRLGNKGDIPAFLIAGPFPNEGALQLRGTGFATDYLQPEATAEPKEGQAVPATKDGKAQPWRLAVVRGPEGIDLRDEFGNYFPGIAYAYAEVQSDRAQAAVLKFGSDDGAKVWINGELRFQKQLARGVRRDEDQVPFELKAGRNRLLFKIEQGDGGWGLTARLTDPEGNPLRLVQTIALRPGAEAKGTAAFAREATGRTGALDLEAAIAYDAWVKRAAFWVKRFRADADRPERLDEALRLGAEDVQVGQAADNERLSVSLRRATQRIESAFTAVRDPWVRRVQDPQPLVKASEGFVRVMPGGRYFVTAAGKPFLPIGYNHNPDWTKLMFGNPMVPDGGNYDATHYEPKVVFDWFAHLKANGVNLVRLMVETPPSGNLEDPVGTIQPEHARWLDNVFLAARKSGIRLMVTPYDTFWMNLRWETTTYSPLKGGPIENKIDWYVKPALREAQKRRMRWLIDRYGNLDTVFAWEVMNEADLWWGASPAQLQTWADDIVRYTREYQRKKWGREHLVSISTAEAMPKNELAEFAFRRKDLDFANTHLYIGANKAPTEPYAVIATMAQGVGNAMAQIRDNRPYIDTENGPIDKWIADEKLDDAVHHNQSWAHLAAGGAGSSLRWPYRQPHHITAGMLKTLRGMRTFVDGVDWSKLTGPMEPSRLELPEGLAGTSHATRGGAIAFVTRTHDDLGKPVSFALSPGAAKRVRVFDTQAAKWLPIRTTKIPAGVKSVAVFTER